jgi:hypothetical protein
MLFSHCMFFDFLYLLTFLSIILTSYTRISISLIANQSIPISHIFSLDYCTCGCCTVKIKVILCPVKIVRDLSNARTEGQMFKLQASSFKTQRAAKITSRGHVLGDEII